LIIIIDNYDSFTYNLVQLVGKTRTDFEVFRNNKVTVSEIASLKPDGIVISPGPGRPEHAGICIELIRTLAPSVPMLGVCLGHQAIGYAFGAQIVHAPQLMHGKTSKIHHHEDPLFRNISNPFEATRYHSLVISGEQLPSELQVTASTDDNIIMAVHHNKYPIDGIQFHPESILTKAGPQIIVNWLERLRKIA
jgi:anthranilate synthase component 2